MSEPSIGRARRCAVMALITAGVLSTQAQAGPVALQSSTNQVTLLELFSSEGCSSCPPAEKWLSALKTSPDLWKDFVPVSFHVDYWNYLGWRDPWSSKAFSDRQRLYARHWGGHSIYTPGFVLNGREWSDWQPQADRPTARHVNAGVLQASSPDLEHWVVSFSPALQARSDYEVSVAMLAGGLVSDVGAGENRGRRLVHDFVVTSLTTRSLKRQNDKWDAEFAIKAPSAQAKGRQAVAVWVTQVGSLEPVQAVGGWASN